MIPATRPRARDEARLLFIDPCQGRFGDSRVSALPGHLRAGDLVVVNDAATLPASLRADEGVEVRLAGALEGNLWQAVLFGAGDWRTPTEHRPAPPVLPPGTTLTFGRELAAEVLEVSPISPRLVTLRFTPDDPGQLYARGRRVPCGRLERPLEQWELPSASAARPWDGEAPSAGLPLSATTLLELRRRGVELATLTHAAGLSATGDPALDAALPLPERYELPADTVARIAATRAFGGRVVAVGTTVVRALEGAHAARGRLEPGAGVTSLRLGPGFRPAVVGGMLTGIHEPGSSHLGLLGAFVNGQLLKAAYAHAEASGYLGHEHGDTTLVLCS